MAANNAGGCGFLRLQVLAITTRFQHSNFAFNWSIPRPPPRAHDSPCRLTSSLYFQVALPIKLALCLVPICVGVALSTWKSEGFPREGAFWATAGLLAAATYQLLVKSTQATLQVPTLKMWCVR